MIACHARQHYGNGRKEEGLVTSSPRDTSAPYAQRLTSLAVETAPHRQKLASLEQKLALHARSTALHAQSTALHAQ